MQGEVPQGATCARRGRQAVGLLLALLAGSASALPEAGCLEVLASYPPGRSALLRFAAAENRRPPTGGISRRALGRLTQLRNRFLAEAIVLQETNGRIGHEGREALGAEVRSQSETTLTAARSWLAGANVGLEPVDLPGGIKGVRIVPDEHGTPLNRFAWDIHSRYGTELIYSPETTFLAGGEFHLEENRVFLSHEAVFRLETTETEMHERLHAHFAALAREGILTPFHVRLFTNQETGPKILEGDNYHHMLTAEEVAAYALTISIRGSRLAAALRAPEVVLESPELEADLEGLRLVVGVGARLTEKTATVTRQAMEKMRKDPKSVKAFFPKKVVGRDGGEQEIFYYDVPVGDIDVQVMGATSREVAVMERELDRRIEAGDFPATERSGRLAAMKRQVAIDRLRAMAEIAEAALPEYRALQAILEGTPSLEQLRALQPRVQALNRGVNGHVGTMPRRR